MQYKCKKHGELEEKDIGTEKTKSGIMRRCRICRREQNKEYRKVNMRKICQQTMAWKRLNRERVREWARQDRINNPEKYKRWSRNSRIKQGLERSEKEILRRRGIDKAKYDLMVLEQDNKCAICKKEETRKSRTKGNVCRLAIDHCHETNIVRGLLCHDCNAGLGHFHDSIEILEQAILYLEK